MSLIVDRQTVRASSSIYLLYWYNSTNNDAEGEQNPSMMIVVTGKQRGGGEHAEHGTDLMVFSMHILK